MPANQKIECGVDLSRDCATWIERKAGNVLQNSYKVALKLQKVSSYAEETTIKEIH